MVRNWASETARAGLTLLLKLTLFSIMRGRAGPGKGNLMISTRLRFALVWGRVSVLCRDLWILGDFC